MAGKQETKSPVDLQKHLKGVDYPANKEKLVEAAKANGAPDEVLDVIGRLPADRFEGPAGVMKAFGELT